jgi:tetratricopeptide (TPR) repeat protein
MKNEKQSTTISTAEIEQLLEMGNQAWQRCEVQEALDAWQRGLELVDRLPDEDKVAQAYLSCRLWSQITHVWIARGLISRATDTVERIECQAEVCACAHPELPALAQLWRARVARLRRDMDQAQQLIHEALRMAQDLPAGERKQRALAAIHLGHGIIALELSENQVAMNALLQARTLYQQLGDRAGEGHSVMVMGRLYEWMSLHKQALAHYQEAEEIFHEAPHNPSVKYAHQLGWGSALNNVEKYVEAVVHYQAALDLARQLGSEPYIARCLNNVGVTLQRQGETETSLKLYLEARELFLRLNDRYGLSVNLSNIGEIYLDLGEIQEALAALEESRRIAEAINFRIVMPHTHYLFSAAYVLLDRPATAFDHAEKALQLAEEIGNLTFAGLAYRALGIAAAALERQGRLPPVVPPEGPEAYFTTSMEILAGMNQVYERRARCWPGGRTCTKAAIPRARRRAKVT